MHISKYLHLQFYPTSTVVNHELVHVIRAVNGVHDHIPPQADYLPTEEGLACYIQDNLQRGTASSFQHALEYNASQLIRTAGFREIYDFLREHGCNSENAWLRGILQKFGMVDTSQPGSLIKSVMYFYHDQLVSQLSKTELLRLFVGKPSQTQLPNYSSYSGQIPQEKIEALLALQGSSPPPDNM